MKGLLSVLYAGFRQAPFILICFFVISSMLNTDIRGVIFLGLLLINCLFTMAVSAGINMAYPGFAFDDTLPEKVATCNATSLGDGQRISSIPLNINIVSFTFAYLLYVLGKEDKVDANVPTIIFFTLLLFAMIMWELVNTCVSGGKLVAAIILGGSLGVGFSDAMYVWSKNVPGLQFFSHLTNEDVCKRVSDEVFECDINE
jgi:hypothetical protein